MESTIFLLSKKWRSKSLILLMLLTCSFGLYAQKSKVYQSADGAIRGYDPVAYFTKGEAVKGLDTYSYEWNDVTWFFSTKEHLNLFQKDPEKYAPQYGGYCAYCVAKGYTAKVDPTAWKIVDGKLYLNYNESVKKNWEEYYQKYISKADENWPQILGEN